MSTSRLWLAVVAAIVLGAIGVSLERAAPPQPHTPASGASRNVVIVWSHGRNGSDANAKEHWEKHGSEFPEDHSEADYVREANAFVHNPPPGTHIKHDARGDTLFYQPATDTFAVMDARGEPRTFFKPDNGYAYWNRQ